MSPVKYRSVLIENEEHSLTRLRRLLSAFEQDLEIVGAASDGPTAVEVIQAHNPDLLFLDIDLPGFNGFEVLERLNYQPAVIFTTAHNEHALKAFDTFAIDYLLKPIEPEAVARALTKLRAMGFNHAQFSRAVEQILENNQTRYLSRISCRIGDRTLLVKIAEVLYFQADNKYTSVHTAGGEYLIDTPLIELIQRLNPRDFVRIHRSTLVNVAWIAEIRRSYDSRLRVVLRDSKDTELVASRSYAETLRNL
jgi:two-component system LytT family response regulator